MEQKSNKGLVWLTVLLIILFIGLISLVVFNTMLKKEKQNNDNTTTTTTTNLNVNLPIKYEMKKKEVIKFEFNENFMESQTDATEYIEYPVISGEDKSIENLNKTILQNVDTTINKIKDEGKIVENNEYNNLCYLKVQDDGKKREYCNYTLMEYEIKDSTKYLTIIEEDWYVSLNGTGSQSPRNFYVIDKESGKVVSNDDLIFSIKNISTLENTLKTYFVENYSDFSSNDVKKLYVEMFNEEIDNKNYLVYFDSEDTLVFYFQGIQQAENLLFGYTEEKGWEDLSWIYLP